MHRAIIGDMGKGAIDGHIGSHEHTEHFKMMLHGDRSVALGTVDMKIAVKYPDCGIQWWILIISRL